MTNRPELDPARAAAMRRMLITTIRTTKPGLGRRITLIISLGIAAVLLAGGGAAWALSARIFVPQEHKPPAHSVAPAPTPTPTPTPTITPTAPPAPAQYTTSCAALVPPSVVNAASPGATLTTASDYDMAPPASGSQDLSRFTVSGPPNQPPSAWTQLAILQSGYFNCTWNATQSGLTVAVLPDADAVYASLHGQQPDGGVELNPGVGEQSFGYCVPDSGQGPDCTVYSLTDGVLLAVESYLPSPAVPSDLPGIQTRLDAVLTAAAADTSGAFVQPQPAPAPDSRWSTITDCTAISSAVDSVLPGLGAPVSTGIDATDDYLPLSFQAAQQASLGCLYSTQTPGGQGADVDVIPGAAWAFPLSYPQTTVSAAQQLNGVDAARSYCQSGNCWIEGTIDGALVVVQGGSATTDAALLEAIAQHTG